MKHYWPLLLLPILALIGAFFVRTGPQAQEEIAVPEDKLLLTVHSDTLGTFEITDIPIGITLSILKMDRSKFIGDASSIDRTAEGEFLFIHLVLINMTKDEQNFDALSIRLLDDKDLEYEIRSVGTSAAYDLKYIWPGIPSRHEIVGTLEFDIPAELTKEQLRLVFNDPITGNKEIPLSDIEQFVNTTDEFFPWVAVDLRWSRVSR